MFFGTADMRALAINAVTTKNPADCPRCGSARIWPDDRNDADFGLMCSDCGWTGPVEGTDEHPDMAQYAWDRDAKKLAAAQALNLTINWDEQPTRKVYR